jgi:uncharacterized protein YaaQ
MAMAIVPEEISSRLLSTLTDLGSHTVLMSAMGGYIRRGNATILIGLELEQVGVVEDKIPES